MRPMDKATANSLSVQFFSMIENTEHGNFVIGRFQTRARNGLSVSDSLCTVAPSPTDTPSPIFFWGEESAALRLSETDNPSSNCPSKLTDKVRRIVHSKLKPFPFQTKKYYLSDANYQTDNPVSSVETAISVIMERECPPQALSWAFACLLLLFIKLFLKWLLTFLCVK